MSEARAGLSRERIVRAAVRLVERDGAEALSMRRVAGELGAATMSLYNHVPSKAALLDAVAEFVLADMEFAADPSRDWRDQARGMARTFRAIARRYPRCVLLVVTRQPRSQVGLRPMELVLAAVRAAGFAGRDAVRLVRTVESFILGSLVREVGGVEPPGSELAELAQSLDEREFHHLRNLLPLLGEKDHDGDFEFGLELLINAAAALPRNEPAVEHGGAQDPSRLEHS